MTTYEASTYQNEYLAEGATEVNAVITVSAHGGAALGGAASADATEILIIDTSGSMQADRRMEQAKAATMAAIDCIRDGVYFAVISGAGTASAVYPYQGLAIASPDSRAAAKQNVSKLSAAGGTAIGSWIYAATALFNSRPGALNHALLLTDGKNEGETPAALKAALKAAEGVFQCDCRGVGTDWVVSELRTVATMLMGTVDLVARPEQLTADFQAVMGSAMQKTSSAALRIWTPVNSVVRFVRQVAPTVEDLTAKRAEHPPRSGDYPIGAWGEESRDYHVCIDVLPGSVGDELLAARVSVVQTGAVEEVMAQTLVRAVWTDDVAVSTRINPQVAHYTGQAELAQVIQEGLEARKNGDNHTATIKLGRAAQLATESGNEGTIKLLRKVVEVEDAATGTVRLKRAVAAEDEMALDTRSTKTVRVKR